MTSAGAGLAVRDIAFRYRRGADELFGGLSHEFASGAVTALTGASGRGKSTLLYIIGLMLTPTSGVVLLDGQQVSTAGDAARSRIRATRMGFVFQDAALDATRTVLDSVLEPSLYAAVPRGAARARALALLDELALAQRAQHRPGEVSGGQAQRVAIARALVNDPVVVLADEPTGNLDRGNAGMVLEVLRGQAGQGRTIVIATHDPFVLEHADHVVAL